MKILAIEQLSTVAGAEPHGTTNGRQDDGYDIWGSGAYRNPKTGYVGVAVGYTDGTMTHQGFTPPAHGR